MFFHDFLDDGKAETGSTGLIRHIRFENVIQNLLRNTFAMIFDAGFLHGRRGRIWVRDVVTMICAFVSLGDASKAFLIQIIEHLAESTRVGGNGRQINFEPGLQLSHRRGAAE